MALRYPAPAGGGPIIGEPFDGPFGRTFADPDGYAVILHDQP